MIEAKSAKCKSMRMPMKRCIVFLVVALAASAGAERAEFTLGGVEGNAWQVPWPQRAKRAVSTRSLIPRAN